LHGADDSPQRPAFRQFARCSNIPLMLLRCRSVRAARPEIAAVRQQPAARQRARFFAAPPLSRDKARCASR